MSLPDEIHLVMLTKAPLRTPQGLQALLDAFEGVNGLRPTHWGPDERARSAYDRGEFVKHVTSPDGPLVPGIRRAELPRFQAHFSAENTGIKQVTVEFGSGLRKKDLMPIFELADRLATALRPEYGIVHLIWAEGKRGAYNTTSVMTADRFRACGPKPPAARTWFGRHIVDLVGLGRIEAAAASVRQTDWGGVVMDLVEPPWAADFATLSAGQSEAMEHLRPSGVFGDYSDWLDCKPGPRWKPVSESES
jgi:hypothetical protein